MKRAASPDIQKSVFIGTTNIKKKPFFLVRTATRLGEEV